MVNDTDDPVVIVRLMPTDLESLKSQNNLATHAVENVVKDDRSPVLRDLTLNLDSGEFKFTFSEYVDPGSFIPSAVTIQNLQNN